MNAAIPGTTETLTLGGGCFWCLEAVFDQLHGVIDVVSGYSGGRMRNPTYGQVTSGTTGHAEVVEVSFDPSVLPRDTVLDVFFAIHDPTTRDRQGNDVGPQYRSIAFFRDEAQKQSILAAIDRTRQSGEYRGEIVTEVVPFEVSYPAEDYHRQYYALHGSEPYCSLVVAPKVAKFRSRFGSMLKSGRG